MHELDAFLETAERNLNDSLQHFEEAGSGRAQEFVEIKLQACIFQYDICSEMVNLIRNQPSGFAACVATKGLVLRLFEYDDLLNTHIIPRLLTLAKARNINVNRTEIKAQRSKWKTEFNQLRSWSDVRNQAAGHYGKNITAQVALLQTLTVDVVMTVAKAFLSFNMSLLQILRSAGLNNAA